MESSLHTFAAFLVLGICIHFIVQRAESQYVPNRCMCLRSGNAILQPFSDFSVTLKRSGCTRDEIIVILKKDNRKVCLSPQGAQGKRLLKCWQRINFNERKKKKCLRAAKVKRRQKKPKNTITLIKE